MTHKNIQVTKNDTNTKLSRYPKYSMFSGDSMSVGLYVHSEAYGLIVDLISKLILKFHHVGLSDTHIALQFPIKPMTINYSLITIRISYISHIPCPTL